MCDIYISFAFHGLVFSTSLAVPSIAVVTYGDYKFYGIIGKMMGLEEYIIDLDIDSSDYKSFRTSLLAKVNQAWTNKDLISLRLTEKAKAAKESALLNGALIQNLIHDKHYK